MTLTVYLFAWLRGSLILQNGILAVVFLKVRDNQIIEKGYISFKEHSAHLKKQSWETTYKSTWKKNNLLRELNQSAWNADTATKKLSDKINQWENEGFNFTMNHRTACAINGYYEYFLQQSLLNKPLVYNKLPDLITPLSQEESVCDFLVSVYQNL